MMKMTKMMSEWLQSAISFLQLGRVGAGFKSAKMQQKSRLGEPLLPAHTPFCGSHLSSKSSVGIPFHISANYDS